MNHSHPSTLDARVACSRRDRGLDQHQAGHRGISAVRATTAMPRLLRCVTNASGASDAPNHNTAFPLWPPVRSAPFEFAPEIPTWPTIVTLLARALHVMATTIPILSRAARIFFACPHVIPTRLAHTGEERRAHASGNPRC